MISLFWGSSVGHTTDFTQRKQCHKNPMPQWKEKYYNLKVYKTIRENGGRKLLDDSYWKYPCAYNQLYSQRTRMQMRDWTLIKYTTHPNRSVQNIRNNINKTTKKRLTNIKNNIEKIIRQSATAFEISTKHKKKERAIKRLRRLSVNVERPHLSRTKHFKLIFHKAIRT
jgi:hypothetical protein